MKNPYNLDFLSLGPESSERDLENALIANIKKFLLELGTGFSYMRQQYHLKLGENDYCLDLLFYHTKPHCYVVVELKITEFTPEFAGKLEFYLNAVNEQLKTELDAPSIGLLLCKSFDKVVVEYSLRNKTKPMGVAANIKLPDSSNKESVLRKSKSMQPDTNKIIHIFQQFVNTTLARYEREFGAISMEHINQKLFEIYWKPFFNELLTECNSVYELHSQHMANPRPFGMAKK